MSNAITLVHQLINERDAAKKNEKGWKAEGVRVDGVLAEVVRPEDHLRAAGKMDNGGSATIEEYGAKFTVEAAKKVVWDSAMLQAVAARMTWAMVESIFKIKFEITEASYKNCLANAKTGMLDPQVMAAIKAARTVEIGEAKIKTAEIIN